VHNLSNIQAKRRTSPVVNHVPLRLADEVL
jgi:hypothetical protein